MSAVRPAPELFQRALGHLGIQHVFGIPGTQNMALFEALRGTQIQLVVPTHELAATFMANGYHRVSQRTALVLTIRGPGFAFTLPAMAEAALDSAAILQLTTAPAYHPERRYLSQALDQASMARAVSKGIFDIHHASELVPALCDAHQLANHGEPGPTLVQIDPDSLLEESEWNPPSTSSPPQADAALVEVVSRELSAARRPILFLGQGAIPASAALHRLAERLGAAVLSSTSGRGVVAESHPLSLGFEFSGTRAEALNELLAQSDRVLALGCRFSQNATRGFSLWLPPEKLIHVDASLASLGANYPAQWKVHAEAKQFTAALLEQLGPGDPGENGWTSQELDEWRARGLQESWVDVPEPRLLGKHPAEFFNVLRAVLPAESHVVTDSGLHQLLARRYFRVDGPAGLVMPSGFQSMGFGLPAAIGARLAQPEHPVAALIGDGGLLMTAMDLLTATHLGLDLRILVINDASFGLIRRSQESAYGAAPSSRLPVPDYASLASSMNANYVRLGASPEEGLRATFEMPGVTLVEVLASDSPGLRVARAKGMAKNTLGAQTLNLLKQLRGR